MGEGLAASSLHWLHAYGVNDMTWIILWVGREGATESFKHGELLPRTGEVGSGWFQAGAARCPKKKGETGHGEGPRQD